MIAQVVGQDYIMPYIMGLFIIFSIGYFLTNNKLPFFTNVIGMVILIIAGLATIDAVSYLIYVIGHTDPHGEIVKMYINGTGVLDNGTTINLKFIQDL